ncbi:Hypothetical predicted protein [Cloeon dipterum]|uniref:Elongin-C n=1 Tax=Cloeon dipterum TaxID=197152 RepID=A0A8S1BNN1_9INSE|nr:Hypothetical predicted protein [Cloeon dipterum]
MAQAAENNGDADFVTLVSSEGKEFVVDRKIATTYSKTLGLMLDRSCLRFEGDSNKIHLSGLSSRVLEYVCKYFEHKRIYKNCPSVDIIPEFDVPLEHALDLLLAAHLLDC